MKRIIVFIFAMALSINMLAQCPIPNAVDFTATDVHGREVHLFDILDGGQYVLIDFFFTTCGGCIEAVPYMIESYQAFGCNLHDVFYIEVDEGDHEAPCLAWATHFGVEYPTISGDAGGTSICGQYMVSSFPTVILIAPNRDIVVRDLYPIYNAQSVISVLEEHGIQQHECYESVDETDADGFSVYPNPASDFFAVEAKNDSPVQYVEIFDMTGRKVLMSSELEIYVGELPKGLYFVKVAGDMQKLVITH